MFFGLFAFQVSLRGMNRLSKSHSVADVIKLFTPDQDRLR